MKKVYSLLTMAVIVAMSLTMASCDGDDYWYDPYGWYDHYDDWGWSNNDWNNGWQGGSQNSYLVAEARLLTGEWYGPVTYSVLSNDGQSRETYEFYADMKFFQYAYSRDALSGEGTEEDYVYNDDGSVADQQHLEFSWYIDDNSDIYIKYKNSGATFVMDYGSSQAGFFLGRKEGSNVDSFFGYMIGTGSSKGDVIYIDLKRVNQTSQAKAFGSSKASEKTVKSSSSFGMGATIKPLKADSSRLNNRR